MNRPLNISPGRKFTVGCSILQTITAMGTCVTVIWAVSWGLSGYKTAMEMRLAQNEGAVVKLQESLKELAATLNQYVREHKEN